MSKIQMPSLPKNKRRNYGVKGMTAQKAESLGYYDGSMGNDSDHDSIQNEEIREAYRNGFKLATR